MTLAYNYIYNKTHKKLKLRGNSLVSSFMIILCLREMHLWIYN